MVTMFGASRRQGPHQLAQKSKTVILFLAISSLMEIGLPPILFILKSGRTLALAWFSTFSFAGCFVSFFDWQPAIMIPPNARIMDSRISFMLVLLNKILRRNTLVVDDSSDGLCKHIRNRKLFYFRTPVGVWDRIGENKFFNG